MNDGVGLPVVHPMQRTLVVFCGSVPLGCVWFGGACVGGVGDCGRGGGVIGGDAVLWVRVERGPVDIRSLEVGWSQV